MNGRTKPLNIDSYIADFPSEVQAILEKIRATIHEVMPEAKEVISYQMPAFDLRGKVIFFAAFKKHIGIYPPVKADEKLRNELSPYLGEKGNLKFPLDEEMPYALIKRVAEARLENHQAYLAAKKVKNK